MPIKILYHGHANLEIHTGPHRIQIDPFYTSNPLADIKSAAASPTHILISHAHFDHIEDALSLTKRTAAAISSNYEITTYFEKQGAAVNPMNHGGGVTLPFGRITYTLAFHTSSFPDGAYGGQPGGWIIELPASPDNAGAPKTIYFAGDTALFADMQLIGQLWNIDLACLPIGDRFTMGPAHAIKAAQMLKAKRVLPIHYNTWEPIKQDASKFATDLKKETGIECAALTPGMNLEL